MGDTFAFVLYASFGTAIGYGILDAVRRKFGKIPWWFTAAAFVLAAFHVWLGLQALGGGWPFDQ